MNPAGCRHVFSPGDTVHGLLVDGRHHEADGGHHRLVSRVVQHLPLEGLRVVEQRALVSFVDGDLKDHRRSLDYTPIQEGPAIRRKPCGRITSD